MTLCIAFGLSNATPDVCFIFQSPPWQKLLLQDSWQQKWPWTFKEGDKWL